MQERRTVTSEHAVELYLTMNGSADFREKIFLDELEDLVPPNGATYATWVGWNRSKLNVVEVIDREEVNA